MPRRAVTRTSTVASSSAPTSPALPPPEDTYLSNLSTLRRCWKWAAFGQFFFTFAPLFAMTDVSISDIEEDLARSTGLYLPRVIQKLLYSLTQDRKISLDNWQSALRKQYARRDPDANPIGFEPKKANIKYSFEPVDVKDESTSISLDTPIADSSVPPGDSVEPEQPSFQRPPQSDDGNDSSRPPEGPRSEHGQDIAQTEEQQGELKDWLDLPMLTKLDSLHLLTEWQFQNPNRLRSIMKDDDETAQWRIEPIGYDAKSHAYWLIGADRLWLQRRPHRPKTLKRKRAPIVSSRKPKGAEASGQRRRETRKRRKVEKDDEESEAEGSTTGLQIAIPVNGTATRAAKTQANKKLDAQAKAFAEFQRQNSATTRSGRAAKRQKLDEEEFSTPRRTLGTRMSKRLRHSLNDEDEWQQVPDEWLDGDDEAQHAAKKTDGRSEENNLVTDEDNTVPQAAETTKAKTGLESDAESISDLTELSTTSDRADSDNEADEDEDTEKEGETEKEDEAEEATEEHDEQQRQSPVDEEFVEWEMICSTLEEWEHIAERFERATYYAEKALFKLLYDHIVPAVIEDLHEIEKAKQEAERKKHVEEAVVHRKRSSRIAIKESEKEEAKLMAKRKTEEVEKMSRAKRLEMRQKREEAERQKKEQAKEQKRLEREGQDQKARKNLVTTGSSIGTSRETSTSSTRIATGSQINGDWELNCEICHRRGINQDDGVPIMSCGSCNKWQHIPCHDAADRGSGRPPRNWETEEFFCSDCSSHAAAGLPSQRLDQNYQPNYAQAKVQLRWDHGRSSPKLPTARHPNDSGFHRVRPELPSPINGYHQPMNNEQYPIASPPVASNSYSNITFSHYHPQRRGFSSSPGMAQQHQPQLPPMQPHRVSHSPSSVLPHNPSVIYAPHNNALANPQMQAYGSSSGFNDTYHQLPAVATPAQNGIAGSYTPRGYTNAPGVNYPHTPGYSLTQDPRLFHHQQQSSSQQWGYSPTTQPSHHPPTNHLKLNGAGPTTDYGI